jgi:filamentous hemagglutinin family protein
MKIVNKLCVYFTLFISASPHAEVLTDGSVGNAVSLSGQMMIPQNLGTTVGNNLFHSFTTFNIKTNESATFTGSAALQNVISRVTGGQVSTIDGLLQSKIAHANFYFINPAGVTFGATAHVDVPAAFHVSTAQKLNFGSDFFDTRINASAPPPSTLIIAEPTSFGFLETSPNNNGFIEINGTQLNPNETNHKTGQTVDLVAGTITIKNNATLTAQSGELRLAAALGEREVSLLKNSDGTLPLSTTKPSDTNAGNVTINNSTLTTDGNGGGRIALWGGKTSFKNASLFSDNSGNKNATPAKGVDIHAYTLDLDNSLVSFDTYNSTGSSKSANVSIETTDYLRMLRGGIIKSNTYTNGSAANVIINANSLNIDHSHIYSQAVFQEEDAASGHTFKGNGGNVTVNAKTLTITKGGDIFSSTATQGNAGHVLVTADNLTINGNKSGIFSEANGKGSAGDVTVNVKNGTITDSGIISSSTFAQGNAGAVSVTADDNLTIDAQGVSSSRTGIFSQANSTDTGNVGNAGNITIDAGKLSIFKGGEVSSSTYVDDDSVQRKSGNILVTTDLLNIDGQGLRSKNTGIFSQANRNLITASSTGKAGNITIDAKEINLVSGGVVSSSTFGQGNSGDVTVTANDLTIDGQSFSAKPTGFFSQNDLGTSGNAGTVKITATNTLNIIQGGAVSSSTLGEGNAGNLIIRAKTLSIDSNGQLKALAANGSTGQVGDVKITADTLNLSNGGQISVQNDSRTLDISTKPTSLNLNIPHLIMNGGFISTATSGSVAAANVAITTQDSLIMDKKASINSSTSGSGNAGSVAVTAPSVLIDNAFIKTTAEQGSTGDAGSVTIIATNAVNATNHAAINSATYGSGRSGNVTITAPFVLIDNALIKTTAEQGSTGDAGSVRINAIESFSAINQASINSATYGKGKAGDVTFNTLNLNLDNAQILALAGKGSSGQTGHIILQNPFDVSLSNNATISVQNDGFANDLSNITPSNLILNNIPNLKINGAIITAASSGNVDAGEVVVETQNPINLKVGSSINSSTSGSGKAGNVRVTAPIITVENASIKATAEKGSTGNAGSVTIIATNAFNATNHAAINSATYGSGNSGNVSITAPTISIDNATIKATAESGSTGDAGSVNINAAHSFSGTNQASINSATYGSGKAGNVTFNTPNLSLDNADILALAGKGSKGQTGQIFLINPQTVNLSNNAKISVQNDGFADDPSKIIRSKLILNNIPNLNINGAIITAATSGNVDAGDVVVGTQNPILLKSGSSINSSTSGSGNAGNVSVTAPTITVDNATIKATAAEKGSTGNAGSVTVTATQAFNARNRAAISSATYGTGHSGNVSVTAPTISIDNASIKASAEKGSTKDAGDVSITATTSFSAKNQSVVNSATYGSGKAGNIMFNTPSLTLDNAQILALAGTGSTGQVGQIILTNPQDVNLINNAKISLQNDGFADDPTKIIPSNLMLDTIPNLNINGAIITAATSGNVNAGEIRINTQNPIILNAGSSINSSTSGSGNAGNVYVTASNILLDNATIKATAAQDSTGNAGSVSIAAIHAFTGANQVSVNSATYGSGNAGNVSVTATTISVDNATIKTTAEKGSTGDAGFVTMSASQSFTGTNQASINSATYGKGKAGNITFNTPSLTLDNAQILALAGKGSTGQVGQIILTNPQDVSLSNNAKISVQNDGFASDPAKINPSDLILDIPNLKMNGAVIITATSGNVDAGDVIVNTQNPIFLNAGSTINSSTSGKGNAGSISVTAPTIVMDNATIKATAELHSKGDAGFVTVNATQSLTAINQASINSSTFGSGKANKVTVETPILLLDSGAEISALAGSTSQGETGVISLNAKTVNLNNGGKITVQNDGVSLNPGSIKTEDLILDVPFLTLNGGLITAATSGNVNAGNVKVTTQTPLLLLAGASINSNTSGIGSAGNVTVNAPVMIIDNANISAQATNQSQGQTGNVRVIAEKGIYLTHNGKISMQNNATITDPSLIVPTSITVSAPDIDLKNSEITTEATGNVTAGDINVNFAHQLTMDPSYIQTTAVDGNGGTITINGGGLIKLDNSGFLTSVKGNGDGGNIIVTANTLLMNNSVIQANAISGHGGDISINLQTLIPSYGSLIKGGIPVQWQPFINELNVIQAASSTGVSGSINLTSPQFNISGSITGLTSAALVLPVIDRTACQSSLISASSLVRGSKGGVPLNEAKAGFIPSTPAAPGFETTNHKSVVVSQIETSYTKKQKDNYSCTPYLF